MKTDAKTMAEIYRHMADNLDNGIARVVGIQFKDVDNGGEWEDKMHYDFKDKILYRIKPKTITLSNGVVIPQYLSSDELEKMNMNGRVYVPAGNSSLFIAYEVCYCVGVLSEGGNLFAYSCYRKAIEASKSLFGID